jgi:hypothetical protein
MATKCTEATAYKDCPNWAVCRVHDDIDELCEAFPDDNALRQLRAQMRGFGVLDYDDC